MRVERFTGLGATSAIRSPFGLMANRVTDRSPSGRQVRDRASSPASPRRQPKSCPSNGTQQQAIRRPRRVGLGRAGGRTDERARLPRGGIELADGQHRRLALRRRRRAHEADPAARDALNRPADTGRRDLRLTGPRIRHLQRRRLPLLPEDEQREQAGVAQA